MSYFVTAGTLCSVYNLLAKYLCDVQLRNDFEIGTKIWRRSGIEDLVKPEPWILLS